MKRNEFRRGVSLGMAIGGLTLLIGILAGMGIAKAAPFTPELEADYAYAEQWWGAVPASCSSVAREVVPQADLEGKDVAGRATMPSGDPVACSLRVADNLIPCARREVVLHEYGHLLGLGHSADPASIMYPVAGGRDCERERLGAEVVELQAAVASLRVRCQAKLHRRSRNVCRRNELRWRGELAEVEVRLDGVQEPQR